MEPRFFDRTEGTTDSELLYFLSPSNGRHAAGNAQPYRRDERLHAERIHVGISGGGITLSGDVRDHRIRSVAPPRSRLGAAPHRQRYS